VAGRQAIWSIRCSAKLGDGVIVILACRRSPCISGAERCSFEFCSGQRNSFPDQLKYPATPNLPALTSIRQTGSPPKNIGEGLPPRPRRTSRTFLRGCRFTGGAEKFAGHGYGHRRVRHVGVFRGRPTGWRHADPRCASTDDADKIHPLQRRHFNVNPHPRMWDWCRKAVTISRDTPIV
jgi:hypothetical protein